MNDKFIYLMEKYFDKVISDQEQMELMQILKDNENLRKEFEEQKKIKEVLSKMKMKNPGNEAWDNYWMNIYNRIERSIAWIVISIGAVLLLLYTSIEVVKSFIRDTQTPFVLKFGIITLIFGCLILLYSVIRERITLRKKDKYKEVQR